MSQRPASGLLASRLGEIPRALVAVFLFLGALASGSTSTAAAANPGALRVRVSWPAARLSGWENADGLTGRRFIDRCRREGWIVSPSALSDSELGLLDRFAGTAARDEMSAPDTTGPEAGTASDTGTADMGTYDFGTADAGGARSDVLWIGRSGNTSGQLAFGPKDDGLILDWRNLRSPDAAARIGRESKAWLAGNARVRWEEAAEILDLTPAENLAFRSLPASGHPLSGLLRGYLRDKRAANLALYLLGTSGVEGLALRLELARAYERQAVPFLESVVRPAPAPSSAPATVTSVSLQSLSEEEQDLARRRFFAWRILASRGRIYGRCDRILLSLASEGHSGMILVVDARDSKEPFVAVYRVNKPLPPFENRGSLLEELL